MKRKIILVLIFILLILFSIVLYIKGKETPTKLSINTLIEETPTYVSSISLPITTDKIFNQQIENHIKKEQNIFKEQIKNSTNPFLIDRDELNIDYLFFPVTETKQNICLITSMSGISFLTPYFRIECFTWDKKEKQILTLNDLIKNQVFSFSNFKNQAYEKLKEECPTCISKENFENIFTPEFTNFQITEKEVIFHFNPYLFEEDYHDSLSIYFDIDDFSFKQTESVSREIEKSLVIKDKTSPNIIDPTKPVVALTFDDGPSQYTEAIIKILKENEVNATFFVLGNKVTAYQDVLRQSIENGNELGNHSYNHKWLSRLSIKEITNQINQTQDILKKTLNYTPRYLRPTYGSINNRIRKNTDLNITLWTVDTKDWKIHNTNRIIEKATYHIEDGDIILMHDILKEVKDALKKIIPILKEQGFQFVTISELEEVKLLRKYQSPR